MKGFSLLEIMVVVAIVGTMAASVVVGFNGFSETVRVRETAGVITDTVKKLELETIRRDYVKNTIHFENDFLVVESEVENQSLPFTWLGVGGGTCTSDQAGMEVDNSASGVTVYLAQRDEYGNNMELETITAGTTEVICAEFQDSDKTEWQYQAFTGSSVSKIIRLIHFNIRRDSSSEPITIDDNQYSLQISAPYAKKIYKSGSNDVTEMEIEISDGDQKEIITLQ